MVFGSKIFTQCQISWCNPGNICYFQGTRESMADPLLIKISEEALKVATSGDTDDSTEVVSEDEGVTTLEDIVCQEASIAKGIAKRKSTYSIDTVLQKKLKTSFECPTVSPYSQTEQREAMLCISGFYAGIQERN